jgi:hypothetical protein
MMNVAEVHAEQAVFSCLLIAIDCFLSFSFVLALEEYENLKRMPDPRQIAAQRLQQQQQLTSAAMIQLPQLQQMYLDFFRTLSAEDQRTLDYSKMLQHAYEIGLTQTLLDAIESNPSMTTTNMASHTTDVVTLDSDDEKSANKE